MKQCKSSPKVYMHYRKTVGQEFEVAHPVDSDEFAQLLFLLSESEDTVPVVTDDDKLYIIDRTNPKDFILLTGENFNSFYRDCHKKIRIKIEIVE